MGFAVSLGVGGVSTADDDSQDSLVINKLPMACSDKNHDKAMIASRKTTMTDRSVKNLPTLPEDGGGKPKDRGSNNLDVASRLSRLDADKRSAVLANNRVGAFLQAKPLQVNQS